MKYHEQLKHPNWQKKRLEVLNANQFTCQDCGSKEKTLEVHHPYYKRGAMVWQYEANELQCLCNTCHRNAHSLDESLKREIGYLDSFEKEKLIGYIKADALADCPPYTPIELIGAANALLMPQSFELHPDTIKKIQAKQKINLRAIVAVLQTEYCKAVDELFKCDADG